MISEFGLTIIATFEKFKPRVYLDEGGKPTIGYGHLIKPGEVFSEGITPERGRELLQQDAEHATHLVDKLVYMAEVVGREVVKDPPVGAIRCQRDALISWTFNLGGRNLADSTMLRWIHDAHPDEDVAEQLIRWVHVDGRRSRGLVRRRHCEAVWYLGAPQAVVLAIAKGEWL